MTNVEFVGWLKDHTTRYPGLKRWLEDVGAEATTAEWLRILRDVPIDEANKASQELVEKPDQPRSYERHPVIVKAIAKRMLEQRHAVQTTARFGGDQETYACPDCQDRGIVSIFVGLSEFRSQFVSRYGEERGPRLTISVPCSCSLGMTRHGNATMRFNPQRHIKADRPFTMLTPATQQAILDGFSSDPLFDLRREPA